MTPSMRSTEIGSETLHYRPNVIQPPVSIASAGIRYETASNVIADLDQDGDADLIAAELIADCSKPTATACGGRIVWV